MIKLPDVTLAACTSTYIEATIHSLLYSAKDIEFGAVKLISDTKPDFLPKKITWEYCPKMSNINEYCSSDGPNYISFGNCRSKSTLDGWQRIYNRGWRK